MASVALDTLRYAKRLEAAGVSREHAEAQAEALSEAVRDSLVTKADLAEWGVRLETKIETVRGDIKDSHLSLLKWLVPLMLGQIVALIAGWYGFYD